jgi:hypothetical protein
MINQSTKDFTGLVEDHVPNIWASCYPRRIIPPNGYANPKAYAASLSGCALMWDKPELYMLPHTVCALTSLRQCQMGVPTYFVRNEFAQAVANTKLPMDFKLSELKWPLDAMLFVLPTNFVRTYFKFDVPFLSICRANKGMYPSREDYAWAMKHKWEVDKWTPVLNENDRLLVHFPCYFLKDLPCDYSGSWPLSLDLTTIQASDFIDATVYERSLMPFTVPETEGAPTPEQEKELQDKMTLFAIKLMLAFTARPHLIKNGSIQRKAQMKHGKPWRDALYNPSTVGWDYVYQRRSTGTGAGEGTRGPNFRSNWTPGHFTHQFIGKRGDADFVPAGSLPRKLVEGTIDWDKVSPEVQAAFWRNHELRWIEPIPPTILMPDEK